jgi:hypothetical protein
MTSRHQRRAPAVAVSAELEVLHLHDDSHATCSRFDEPGHSGPRRPVERVGKGDANLGIIDTAPPSAMLLEADIIQPERVPTGQAKATALTCPSARARVDGVGEATVPGGWGVLNSQQGTPRGSTVTRVWSPM